MASLLYNVSATDPLTFGLSLCRTGTNSPHRRPSSQDQRRRCEHLCRLTLLLASGAACNCNLSDSPTVPRPTALVEPSVPPASAHRPASCPQAWQTAWPPGSVAASGSEPGLARIARSETPARPLMAKAAAIRSSRRFIVRIGIAASPLYKPSLRESDLLTKRNAVVSWENCTSSLTRTFRTFPQYLPGAFTRSAVFSRAATRTSMSSISIRLLRTFQYAMCSGPT
jgi:hypothetical protein